ncbi:hypothetical protein [Flavobacterium chungnamense]|uniref:Uncharacterized protein n=1 Tax=Flavobacterium chungnamense TaxID=706182 RepID=A0ABP7V738_9FLAO
MKLFFDIPFLRKIDNDLKQAEKTNSLCIIDNILSNYDHLDIYIEEDSSIKDELETLGFDDDDSSIFDLGGLSLPGKIHKKISSFNSNWVDSIENELNNLNEIDQVLVFTYEKRNFQELEKKGILCFNYSNYVKEIQAIIDICHIKIDLSYELKNIKIGEYPKTIGNLWNPIKDIVNKLTFNKIVINDKYILVNNYNQKIEKNLGLFLNQILFSRKNITIDIYTSNFIQRKKNESKPSITEILKDVEEKWNLLNSKISDNKIGIISNLEEKEEKEEKIYLKKMDFHDRIMYFNYLVIDSTKGFNLMPHIPSNSQIIFETIFNKYTYDRIINHNNLIIEQNKFIIKEHKKNKGKEPFLFFPKEGPNNWISKIKSTSEK